MLFSHHRIGVQLKDAPFLWVIHSLRNIVSSGIGYVFANKKANFGAMAHFHAPSTGQLPFLFSLLRRLGHLIGASCCGESQLTILVNSPTPVNAPHLFCQRRSFGWRVIEIKMQLKQISFTGSKKNQPDCAACKQVMGSDNCTKNEA